MPAALKARTSTRPRFMRQRPRRPSTRRLAQLVGVAVLIALLVTTFRPKRHRPLQRLSTSNIDQEEQQQLHPDKSSNLAPAAPQLSQSRLTVSSNNNPNLASDDDHDEPDRARPPHLDLDSSVDTLSVAPVRPPHPAQHDKHHFSEMPSNPRIVLPPPDIPQLPAPPASGSQRRDQDTPPRITNDHPSSHDQLSSDNQPSSDDQPSSDAQPSSEDHSPYAPSASRSIEKATEVIALPAPVAAKDSVSKLPPISAIVLFHNEYPTLNHTLETWENLGFFQSVSEVLFFLNGMPDTKSFYDNLPRLQNPKWKPLLRVINSEKNLPLGLAIFKMVKLARHDLVLLLEKDWALIEPQVQLNKQLATASALIQRQDAQVVRFRHRRRPGAPLHARIMHQNREKQILQQQSNLFCYVHHWRSDLDTTYPEYFSRCPGTPRDENVWCSTAKYCQWTNNPAMFDRKWFIDNLGNRFEEDYQRTVKSNPNDGMLDFEFYTNWNMAVWNNRNYTVALPVGLFEHQEVGEQNLMNTVWYAWNRLSTDVQEKRNEFFSGEKRDCESANKKGDSGPLYKDKFPLDFVHMYHYDQAMNRTVDEAVEDLRKDSERLNRQLENGGGSWRGGVTELTNKWYSVCLYHCPVEPRDMNLAFVSMYYPSAGSSKDKMKSDIDRFTSNLHILRRYNMFVYTDTATAEQVRIILKTRHGWSNDDMLSVNFVEETKLLMFDRLLGKSIQHHVTRITAGKSWQNLVKERSNSTTPSTDDVSFSLVTPFVLRDAVSRSRHEETATKASKKVTHFVWFDGLSPCVTKVLGKATQAEKEGTPLADGNDYVFRGHMLLNTLVSGTTVSSKEALEQVSTGSGFSSDILLEETEVRNLASGLRVVDGRTMGGSHLAVTLSVAYYEVVLRSMLYRGHVGTRREPLTIAMKNVEYTFSFFDSLRECGILGCDGRDSLGVGVLDVKANVGCKLYEWAGRCARSEMALSPR